MLALSKDLSKLETTEGIEFVTDQNKINGIGMNGVTKVIVLPDKEQDMFVHKLDNNSLNTEKLGITKLTSRNQTVVLNIDAKGRSSIKLPSIVYNYNGNISKNEETSSPSKGNVIVNIYDSKEVDGIFRGKVTTGMENNIFLLVPGGDIEISEQFNGIAIGQKVKNNGTEIHRDKPTTPPRDRKINIPVNKLWIVKDESTIADKTVEVKLLENGEFKGKTIKLTKANGWQGEFESLPVKDGDGKDIVYTIEEIDIPGFDKGHGGSQDNGFMLINSERPLLPPERVEINIPVNKLWIVKDESTIADKTVEVKLLENGEFKGKTIKLTKANGWKGEFESLPVKNVDGKDMVYTIEEIDIPGFDKGHGGNQNTGFTLINSERPLLPPEEVKINIPVTKVWENANGEEAHKEVRVVLLADGKEVEELVLKGPNWKGSFENLAKYKEGTDDLINYTIKELPIEGYSVAIKKNEKNGFVVTNTKTDKPVEFMAMSIEKNWEDEKGSKLDKILDADGKEVKEIIVELTSTETGSKVRTITLKAADNWKFKIDKLPKIDKETGKKIQYSLKEISKISGFKLKNIKDNSDEVKFDFDLVNQRDIPVEEKINIPVEKVWKVKDESTIADKLVEVKLLENGVFNGKILELTKANGWKGEFKNLPIKDATGKAIVYTIEEIDIPGFDKGMGGNQENGFTLINAERPLEPPVELIDIPVEKTWLLKDPSKIKESVSVILLIDGQESEITLELNDGNNWKGEFKNLVKRDWEGRLIDYDIKELGSEEFDKGKGGNQDIGFELINAERPIEPPIEIRDIPVEKTWLLKDPSKIKESVSVILLINGQESENSLELNDANNWKGKFKNLPVKDVNGKLINYDVKEIGSEEFDKGKGGNQDTGFKLINAERPIEPPVELKINIPVEKIWKVKDESKIAAKVEVKLLENGEFNGRILELTKANGWKGEFENLPAKDATGKAIVYTIEEIDIPGFDKGKGGNQDTGFILINAERPLEPPVRATTGVAVEKRWKVANEKTIENKEVEVRLLENGQFKGKLLKLNKANGWKDQFANLPTRDGNGEFIKYDVEEVDMAGFYKDKTGNAEDGFILINSEKPTEPEKPVDPDPKKPTDPDPKKPTDPEPKKPTEPEKPVDPKPKDPIEPDRPREPEDPTEGIDQPDIPRGRGENPNEPNGPDGPKDPIKKTPKDKNANPQTYKPGSFRLIVELVLAMGIIFYLRKRRSEYVNK